MRPPTRWAVGVTTVPERADSLLPATLESLSAAGFPRPRLFIDGCDPAVEGTAASCYRRQGLEVTTRWPRVLTFGNWILGLIELYVRDPGAGRFAMFQDDVLASRNLRPYLDRLEYPEAGYWNLYTFPQNEELAGGREGWFPSNQRGLGALGLVFDWRALTALLAQRRLADKPTEVRTNHRKVDGVVMDSMAKAGYKEFCHVPSLLQHCGDESTMKSGRHPKAATWRGEGFDCLGLLK